MKNINIKTITATLLISGFLAGCSGMSKTQKGVAIGAGAGGAVGAGIGKAAGNTALGAIIGATVGGVAGGIIGRQMDKQAEELEKIPGAEVKRVGEGINVTFESGVLFAIDQSTLTSDAETKIKDLANVLNKYPETYILIEGHTDASGTDAHNMRLSQRRAAAVQSFLHNQNISSSRTKIAWYGENQPKVPNDTKVNMTKNRRVEFAIYANEQMKEKAKLETAGTN